jgi:polyphosphate kinase 2 (PPK2 family)
LRELQIELVKFQRDLVKRGDRIVVLIEGRDAAGKPRRSSCCSTAPGTTAPR